MSRPIAVTASFGIRDRRMAIYEKGRPSRAYLPVRLLDPQPAMEGGTLRRLSSSKEYQTNGEFSKTAIGTRRVAGRRAVGWRPSYNASLAVADTLGVVPFWQASAGADPLEGGD